MSLTSSPQHGSHLSPRSRSEDRSLHYRKPPTSTGGGRAWSEEEENFLIEHRQHKMPYKHIAQQLQKTELACRLHYHQLSFGTKRRRRGSSVSSVRSGPPAKASEVMYTPQRQLPAFSPPISPGNSSRPSYSRDITPPNPVPILPKPVLSPQSMLPYPSNTLHLVAQTIETYDEYSPRIDKDRLLQLYDAHRGPFWTALAREYGDNISPLALEETWRKLCASQLGLLPPTPPSRSPHTPLSRPAVPSMSIAATGCMEPPYIETASLPSIFTPPGNGLTNPTISRTTTQLMPRYSSSSGVGLVSGATIPPKSSFAIASLLTENKDVRQMRPVMA